ncbi:MAG TPA: FxLYD domain-containing protein [Rhodanobacter sp.]|nr:FxLYD domain-containing protein [Rhodanobacter sp.]
MKYRLLVPALCLLAPLAAQAACSSTDFAIKDFAVTPGAHGSLSMAGELVNNCAEAAAAQVEVQAKDAQGNVVQAKKAWPAGTTNIAPGQSVKFNVGRQFHYEQSMQAYTAGIVNVRSW